jgi:hypothetical protein
MQNLNLSAPVRRRSSRVAANVPILVVSKDPTNRFSEICQTLVVSAHGCLFRSPIRLDSGSVVHFHTEEGRQNTGRVVYCQAIESDQRTWKLAAQFDRPENFWGLKDHPKDWVVITTPERRIKAPAKAVQVIDAAPTATPVQQALDRIQQQVSDEHLRAVVAELVRPLQAEVASLREKLPQGEARRSKFEVSLSQIPPELEEQIETRLRKELAPRMLEQARQQSAEVLESAKNIIAQKTREGQEQFVQRIIQQTQAAEGRVQLLAEENAAGLREQVRVATADFQQRVSDAGNRLKRVSEEQLESLQRNLSEEHETRRHELEQMQTALTVESSRLQDEAADLNTRIENLDSAVRRLESGLDKRLGQMASDTVTAVRTRLETEIDALLKVLESRGTQELGKQVDEARARLDIVQSDIEADVSASLRSQVNQTLESFERSLDDLATQSAAEWRETLSRSLNSVLQHLGDELGQGARR